MSIKSLLHFDSATVTDEVQNGLVWSGACLQDSSIAKFGTGCFTNGTLELSLDSSTASVFAIPQVGGCEFEFFLREDAALENNASEINRFSVMSLQGTLKSSPNDVDGTSFYLRLRQIYNSWYIESSILEDIAFAEEYEFPFDNQWHHFLLRIKNTTLQLFIDGNEVLSLTSFEREANFYPTSFRLSTIEQYIYIDEFVFRDSVGIGAPTIPTRAYSLDVISQSSPNTTIINSILKMIGGTIQLKGGTSADMTASNPFLARREIAVEVDTGKIKVGDGDHYWNNLPYVGGEASSSLEPPAIDNNVYVMKNGQWVQATLVEQPSEWAPAINATENIVLTVDEDMTPYQLTGDNVTT